MTKQKMKKTTHMWVKTFQIMYLIRDPCIKCVYLCACVCVCVCVYIYIYDFPGGAVSICLCWRPKRCRFNLQVGKIPLEEEMATLSSTLPRKSHGQRTPVGYSPWGCRVGNDWVHVHVHASAHTHTHTLTHNILQPTIQIKII